MSLEKDIVAALLTKLQAISIAGGYTFDIDSANVFDWRYTPLSSLEQLPCIILRDEADELDEEDEQRHLLDISFVVIVAASAGMHSIRDKRLDIQKVINDFYLSDPAEVEGIAGYQYLGSTKFAETTGKSPAYAIEITYRFIYYTEIGSF